MEGRGLTAEWLEAGALMNADQTNGGGINVTSGMCGLGQYNTIDYYGQWWPGWTTIRTETPRPIKLSMGEVERLRKAAKADDALKAILKKFTAQIEVLVEF